jgi:outer membrane lipoprotein-sorting protein
MTLLNKSLKSLLIASLVSTPMLASAETAEEKGMRIAVEAKESDNGWKDMQASMNMILRNKLGQESIREIRMKSLEVEGDGDKSLSVFDKPRDVKGTAFLSFSHSIGADDQWLYLPKLKRVKRIASRNKSGPFMGSEFSYEDLSSFEVEKYTYKFLKDEPCEGGTCHVIEQYPTDKNSGYTRRVVWLDQAEYRPWKIDFYDRKDSPLKTLSYHSYQEYKGKHWRPDLMKMVNHQTGKSTDLTYGGYTFQTGLSDSDFNKNTLKRAR